MRIRTWQLWTITVVVTLLAAVYQRITGPTWPLNGTVQVGGAEVKFKLLRTHPGAGDAEIALNVPDQAVSGTVEFRRVRSRDLWTRQDLSRAGDSLVARLPHQPPAGKVAYRIRLAKQGGAAVELTPEPVIIRFRGDVPALVLIPHIVLMFTGMLLSNVAALEALSKGSRVLSYSVWALIGIAIGGLALGPVVQNYAFNAYWTGWPMGEDLTDNKTALSALAWALAVWRVRRSTTGRGWVIAAAIITMAAYLIPHSTLGSELDYTTGAPGAAGAL